MTFFTQEKGSLLPEKRHLAKLGGLAPPAPPPGSYAPDNIVLMRNDHILVKIKIAGRNHIFPLLGIENT
jgi:hypothetical protein